MHLVNLLLASYHAPGLVARVPPIGTARTVPRAAIGKVRTLFARKVSLEDLTRICPIVILHNLMSSTFYSLPRPLAEKLTPRPRR